MDNSSKVIEFLYTDLNKRFRVDSYVSSYNKQYSRSYIKKLILEGSLFINSLSITDPSYKLINGDKVKIVFPEIKSDIPEPQNIPLDIVFEDENLLVINKFSGMVVHPAPGNSKNTLVNALLYHCNGSLSGIGGVMRPGIVHRLDKDTSGLMIVAKDDYSHRFLSKAISLKKVDRLYSALVWGKPNNKLGSINLNIGRHPKNRKKMAVVRNNGRSAITDYKLIESYNIASLLECSLRTGRTHQIRVHLSFKGFPIIGDQLYSKRIAVSNDFPDVIKNFNRQALHSRSIRFQHPINKKILAFEAKLPKDIMVLKKELEKYI
tara:strand:- start:19081 stop:20040 length:960 start_codon:yes stop_codon:yes gene_type:complete